MQSIFYASSSPISRSRDAGLGAGRRRASLLVSLADRSFYAVPSLEWGAAENLCLSAGGLLPSGPRARFDGAAAVPDSEFGLYDRALYASPRKYF